MADWYAEDATYGWMYTPDEHFMAVGRDQIRDLAIGQEMAGLDGWHYDYQATVIDEQTGMVVGFWKQRSGIVDDATGREFEILGIGGSWFGRRATGRRRRRRPAQVRLAAGLVRPRVDRAHVPRHRRLRKAPQGLLDRMSVNGMEQPGHYRLADLPSTVWRRRSSAATSSPSGRRPVTEPTVPPAQLLVDGKLTGASDGATYPILDPATGREIGWAPDATAPTSTPRSRPPGAPSTRPTGRPTSASGCAACASCTRPCSTRRTRSGRSPPPRSGCRRS